MIHYNRSRINNGQIKFVPGDEINVAVDDFPRMR
jgi:hypothetical protein